MRLYRVLHTSLTTRIYILAILVVILTCLLISSCGAFKGRYKGEKDEWEWEYHGINTTNDFSHLTVDSP